MIMIMSDLLISFVSNPISISLALLTLPFILRWSTSTTATKSKQTNLVFYVHDNFSSSTGAHAHAHAHADDDNDTTSITVAGTEGPIASSILKFGTLAAVDAPVTEGPDPNSKEIGRARGFYINSQLDGKGLHLVFSVVFTDGEFKGSSLEIQGDDPFGLMEREYAIVAGTGFFRFVMGFGILTTEFLDIGNLRAILKHDVTVKHY